MRDDYGIDLEGSGRGWLAGTALAVVGAAAVLDHATGTLTWVLTGALVVVGAVCGVAGRRAGAGRRRRRTEIRRQRGYLPGEQPWSWPRHAAQLATPVAFVFVMLTSGFGTDEGTVVDGWLGVVVVGSAAVTAATAATSAVQRARRHGLRPGPERAPGVQRGFGLYVGLLVVYLACLGLLPGRSDAARAAGVFGVVVGLAVAAGVAIVWWRDRRQRRTGPERVEAQG